MKNRELTLEIVKALREGGPQRWVDLRNRLYPKFQEDYEVDSFSTIMARCLDELVKDGIVVKVERTIGRKKIRKKTFYMLKDELKASSILYASGVVDEDELLSDLINYFKKLRKTNEQEFRRALTVTSVGTKEELILKIKTLDTWWFQHIKDKYFGKPPNPDNPMVFIIWWNRIVDDLHSMIEEWRDILWFWRIFEEEYHIGMTVWEKIRDITELLEETVNQLKIFIEVFRFADEVCGVGTAKVALETRIKRILDEEGKRFEKILRNAQELEKLLADYAPKASEEETFKISRDFQKALDEVAPKPSKQEEPSEPHKED